MRIQYEQAIYELMRSNERILALVADSGTGRYKDIQKEMPGRYIDFGAGAYRGCVQEYGGREI